MTPRGRKRLGFRGGYTVHSRQNIGTGPGEETASQRRSEPRATTGKIGEHHEHFTRAGIWGRPRKELHTYERKKIYGATPSKLLPHPTIIKFWKRIPISKPRSSRSTKATPQRSRKQARASLSRPRSSRDLTQYPPSLSPPPPARFIPLPTTSHSPAPPQTRPSPYYSPNCSIASASGTSSSSRPSPLLLSAVPPRWDSYR